MKKDSGNWGCVVACVVIMAAMAYVLYGRGRHSPGGPETPPQQVSAPGNPAPAPPPSPTGQILFKTSETYFDKVAAVCKRWNDERSDAPEVHMLDKEGSREAMQHIRQPTGREPLADMWLSSTEALIEDLGRVDGTRHVNLADSSRKVLLPPQPLVFLVRGKTNEVDAYLRQSNPLPSLPKEMFHYSTADILVSGGGDSAARYLKWAYQQRTNQSQSFKQFLEDLKARGFVARLKDSGPLAADFAADMPLTFILVHKALADREAARPGSDLHVIVPRCTLFEQPAVVILQAGLDRHGDKAKEFLQFLSKNIDLPAVTGAHAIEDTGDVNDEKRTWETVFNGGKRLDIRRN